MKNPKIDIKINSRSLSISPDREVRCLEDIAIIMIKSIEAAYFYKSNKITIEIEKNLMKDLASEAKIITNVEVS